MRKCLLKSSEYREFIGRIFLRERNDLKQKCHSALRDNWLIIANLIILLLMAIFHAMEAGHYVNFIPINGTFQDYNPIRRFLNGQIPYKDFQDYLGLGHLYLGTIFTKLLGGDYRASLIAFRLIAFLSTGLIFYVISRITLKKSRIALSFTNLLLAVLLIQPTFFTSLAGDKNVQSALDYAMTTGNSARMLRGAILPMSVYLILRLGIIADDFIKSKNFQIKNEYIYSILAGCLAGFCFPWSNDYGISSWLCVLLMTFYISFARNRRICKAAVHFIIALGTSLVFCFIIVEIATLGHFTNWCSATFGTGGYQTWYYISSKSYYITEVDFSYIELIQAFLGVFYLGKVWIDHGSRNGILRYSLLAYMNLTSFCAVNEYKLLSGAYSREVALVILFGTIAAEVALFVGKASSKEKVIPVLSTASFVVAIAWIFSAFQTEFNFWALSEREGVYVEKMGGYMTSLGEDILATADFLGEKKTFATYASGQEVVSGCFQPSGTDYLIHVLGDKQRDNYLESFENDDFDYAVTINETYSGWEFWLQRSNWFFYQSLFNNWHPIYANTYEIYWERNDSDENSVYTGDISVRVEGEKDSRSIKIIVEADESVCGMADVYIDYNSDKDDGKTAWIVINTMVDEVNTGVIICDSASFEHTYLRSSSQEYIPVTVVNGYGEVTLTAKPEKSMVLTVNEVSCSRIFTVQYDYLYIDEVIETEDSYILHVNESNRARIIMSRMSRIRLNDKLVDVSVLGDGYISILKRDIALNEDFLECGNVFYVE